MSKYTTEVRFICENLAGLGESEGGNSVWGIIQKSWNKIFDSTWNTTFDSAYKSVLCQKILRHFYTREIGFETVGLWVLKINTKMAEIMPYYNTLYKAEQLLAEVNPLWDTDLTTTGNKKGVEDEVKSETKTSVYTRTDNLTGTRTDDLISDSTGNVNTNNLNKYSDTPQGELSGLLNDKYLTNATVDNGTQSSTGSVKNTGTQTNKNTGTQTNDGNDMIDDKRELNSTEDYTTRVLGKSAGKSYSQMFEEFAQALRNIDMLIIDELEELFMGVW